MATNASTKDAQVYKKDLINKTDDVTQNDMTDRTRHGTVHKILVTRRLKTNPDLNLTATPIDQMLDVLGFLKHLFRLYKSDNYNDCGWMACTYTIHNQMSSL